MPLLRIIALLSLILFFNSSLFAQNFSYTQSFETSNPFQFWTSNGTYKINFFGPSGDRSVDGNKSLKMDITVYGNGSKECYYYWTLPVKTNLHGSIKFSANLWMSSQTAKYVQLGYHYAFPPTGIERTPFAPKVTQYNTWFKQDVDFANDAVYHAGYFSDNKIYASTVDDFGRELSFIQLIIKATGTQRLVFYIDKIEVKGTVLTSSAFVSKYKSTWSTFQNRLTEIVKQKHQEYNNLPSVPGLSNLTLTTKAQEYLRKVNTCKTEISNLFKQVDGKEYFAPETMEELEYHLGMYPSYLELLKTELNNPGSKLALFSMNPTKYNRLTGTNIPENIEPVSKLTAKITPGEYEPLSLFLQAKTTLSNIKINCSSLSGSAGTIPSSALDVYIAKVWYQKGYELTGYEDKWLTQELLLKNDNLIKVDESAKTNSILVQKSDGSKSYVVISNPNSTIPKNVKVKDSDVLLPFTIPQNRNRQLWIIVHVPDAAAPGKYSGKITISYDGGSLAGVPVEITVLPFKLENPVLDYAIYYHGYVNDWSWQDDPFTAFGKKSSQILAELKDMKEHGISYPTTYQSLNGLALDLNLRNKVGFPKDKLFSMNLVTGNPTSSSELNALKNQVSGWKNRMAAYGYKNLYVYGIDEARGSLLTSQRKAWEAVHTAGAKVFAAGYYETYYAMGDLLDLGVIQPQPRKEQAELYHSRGNKIYNYHNPMVGIENPEAYRNNYGFLLWKSGYDGVMNYAYQRGYNHIWNDFDIEPNQPHPYRDHNFTYPVSDGVISTIQWEGFREGVDDIRYLSTLLDRIASLKAKGGDVTNYQRFVNSIDPMMDPDELRNDIINQILLIDGSGGVPGGSNNSAFSLKSVAAVSSNKLRLTFSSDINSGVYTTANYSIDNGITVSNAVLTESNVITLTTSAHTANKTYTITLQNLRNASGDIISSAGFEYKYTPAFKVGIKSIVGTLAGGAALRYKAGSLGSKVAYCSSTSSTIKFTVSIPYAGNYYIWGRFFYEGSNNDPNSFFLSVDNNPKKKFGNNKSYFNKWHWDGDGEKESGLPSKLPIGWLSSGKHTITISGREPGYKVMVDMIIVTSNSNYVPTDTDAKLLKENLQNSEENIVEIPEDFELAQNYPNPFNPTTIIKYAIPEHTIVTLKIFDILGKEVTVLVNEEKEPGYYQIDFNASNLASGIYIYHLQTKEFIQSKKMMLIK